MERDVLCRAFTVALEDGVTTVSISAAWASDSSNARASASTSDSDMSSLRALRLSLLDAHPWIIWDKISRSASLKSHRLANVLNLVAKASMPSSCFCTSCLNLNVS